MHRWFTPLSTPNAWEYVVLHFAPDRLASASEIEQQVSKDLAFSGLKHKNMRDGLIMLNYLGEAITADLAQPLVDHLRSHGAKVAGIFMTADRVKADYPWRSIPAWCANHDNWLTRYRRRYGDDARLYTDHKVICINRKMSALRHAVVDRLLDMVPRSELIVSRESQFPEPTSRTIYLDGPVSAERQHEAPPQKFLQAAVKIITEGNEQGLYNTPESTLVSEKTFKCFAWRQFPLWVSVPGTVAVVRQLGFDVFDDLFHKHDYDMIMDQDQRMRRVMEIAEQFTDTPLWRLSDLRHKHASRLQRNYQQLLFWSKEQDRLYWKYRNLFTKMFVDNHSFRV